MQKKFNRKLALFLASASVYFGQAAVLSAATPERPAARSSSKSDDLVKILPDTDPFATAPVPDAEPSTGTSVSKPVVNLTSAGTVEIHVNDANLVEVLRMLSLQSQKNIIASKDVKGTVTANLYDVTVREALDALLAANGFAYREKGNFIYIYTAKEIAEIEKAARVQQTRTFRLYYTPAANAQVMIKPVLSNDAQVAFTTAPASGLETGAKDLGGTSHAIEDILVVTDYTENLDRVEKVLKEIDRRPQQILVEATILRATLTDDNALGVDFNIAGGVDFNQLVFNNGGQLVGANMSGTGGLVTDSRVDTVGTGNTFTSPIQGGLKVGVVSQNVSLFIAALEQVTDTAVLANPKVLALNKQKGEVIVGRKDGYTTSSTTDTSTTQTVEFLDTGTRLIFRPYIGDDGYIRMEIHPEDSSGGLTSANLPFKVTTEVTSNVMVKDGHTIVIGGLFRESSESSRSQVPGIGNVPYLGALFRNKRDRTTREEIIIMLTPHIIKDDRAYAAASEQEMKEAERLRVGVRRGMMITGRERLAETYYDRAVRELNKPDHSEWKVRWYLDAATNLNPKFREAIVLKEQVTGKVVTSVTNSSIRDFVRNQAMADRLREPAAPEKIESPTTKPGTVQIGEVPATQPTTQPAPSAVAEAPATQPAADEAVAEAEVFEPAATTQPAAEEVTAEVEAPASEPMVVTEVAEAPATQPAAEVAEVTEVAEVADVPATQPAVDVIELTEAPATQPAAEVAEVTEAATTQPAVEVVELPSEPAVAEAVPATQPSDKPATTITELPLDEAAK